MGANAGYSESRDHTAYPVARKDSAKAPRKESIMTRRSPESSSKKGKPLPPKPSKESEFKKPVAWLLGRQLIASLKGVVLLAIYGGKLDPRDWMRANVFSVRGRDGHEIVESQEAP